MGTSLSRSKEEELVALLRRNVNLFSRAPSDMPDIDTRVVCHRLAIDPIVKLISQRNCKVREDKRATIGKKVQKLTSAYLITEVKYLSWMTNIVLVRKSSNK